jgi:hypothetical protein
MIGPSSNRQAWASAVDPAPISRQYTEQGLAAMRDGMPVIGLSVEGQKSVAAAPLSDPVSGDR